MAQTLMNLKVLLPFRVFMETGHVKRIVMETSAGAYGLLPERLDCVAALVPGILTYENAAGEVHYLAIDEGVMVKAGSEVLVSVRNAVGGADLGKLRESLEKEIKILDKQERDSRTMMAKLESSFIQNMEKLYKQ